jgi:hypothetical protein
VNLLLLHGREICDERLYTQKAVKLYAATLKYRLCVDTIWHRAAIAMTCGVRV